jgi:hypothetical protein
MAAVPTTPAADPQPEGPTMAANSCRRSFSVMSSTAKLSSWP